MSLIYHILWTFIPGSTRAYGRQGCNKISMLRTKMASSRCVKWNKCDAILASLNYRASHFTLSSPDRQTKVPANQPSAGVSIRAKSKLSFRSFQKVSEFCSRQTRGWNNQVYKNGIKYCEATIFSQSTFSI